MSNQKQPNDPVALAIASGSVSKKVGEVIRKVDGILNELREASNDPVEHVEAIGMIGSRLRQEQEEISQLANAAIRSLVMKDRTLRELEEERQRRALPEHG